MATVTRKNHDTHYETNAVLSHPLLSWRSVVAGLLVSFFTFITLMSLGLALGGVSLEGGVDASTSTAGIIGGVWFLATCLISLVAGSYFAARIAKFHTSRIAGAQGIVMTALFFGVMFWQISNIVGFVAGTAGSAVSTATNAAANAAGGAAQNPELQNRVESATSGVTGTEIQNQVNQLRDQAAGVAPQAREAAAGTMQAIGWSLFVSMILGALASFGGGALAAAANVRKPLFLESAMPTRMTGAAI